MSAITFRSEVWRNVLIPHLWDDEAVTKLWMSTPDMQTIVKQRLRSLVITVRRTGRRSNDGKDHYYTHPPFLPLLSMLQYLWMMVPDHLESVVKNAGVVPNIICTFPPSLRFLDTNNSYMLSFSFDNYLRPVDGHILPWMSSRDDITLGPMLSKHLVTDNRLLIYIWKSALECIKAQTYALATDANLFRHLTHLPGEIFFELRALADVLWDTPIFKSLSEQVTTGYILTSEPSNAQWIIKHFPNLVSLRGWLEILPYRLTRYSCIMYCYDNSLHAIPALPSNLTKITMTIHDCTYWPARWPESLTDLHMTVHSGSVSLDDFHSHIRSLPVHLEKFRYFIRTEQDAMDDDWWDVATTSALPRTLKHLRAPDLPNGWTADEVAILAALPSNLTTISPIRYRGWYGSWMDTLPTAAWEVLPTGLTSLDISTREVVYPVAPNGKLVWSAEVRDLTVLMSRFTHIAELNVLMIGLDDPLPAFADTVKTISIKYYDDATYWAIPYHVSLHTTRWPSQLETLRVWYNLNTTQPVSVSGQALELLPDTVVTVFLSMSNTVPIDLPKRWPKALAVVTIRTNDTQRLINGIIKDHETYLPNTNRVYFTVNNQRIHYPPLIHDAS